MSRPCFSSLPRCSGKGHYKALNKDLGAKLAEEGKVMCVKVNSDSRHTAPKPTGKLPKPTVVSFP